jgi:hypothetical protein
MGSQMGLLVGKLVRRATKVSTLCHHLTCACVTIFWLGFIVVVVVFVVVIFVIVFIIVVVIVIIIIVIVIGGGSGSL